MEQFAGKVQERWARLSDDDIATINGEREMLEGRLQELYGLEREQAKKDVDEFCKSA